MMAERKWLMLSYKVPSEPSRKRVYVWRKLKELGAVYLQQGVGILPESSGYRQNLEVLREEIKSMEGECTLAELSFLTLSDEEDIIQEFEKLRNEEYAELIEQCEGIIFELERETQRGKYTFAEIEENEEDLTKILRWIEKIKTRDFFNASGRSEAEATIEKAQRALNKYAEEVYQKESGPEFGHDM